MLAGRYPSDRFSGLRPRVVLGPCAGPGARRAKARSASRSRAAARSPIAGLFGVFLPDGVRVGELDEEMVYESRAGETFVLGATTWRIEEITFDRVVVTPAPGEPGKTPFWRGDRPGRPLELGRALGGMVRELARAPRRRGRDTAARRRARRERGEEPAAVSRRAGRVDGLGSRRSHDRHRALPGRDRRLAHLHPHAVRLAGARAVGARARGTAGAGRHAGPGALVRRRHHPAAARSDRGHPARAAPLRTRRGRGPRGRTPAEHVVVRVALP